MKKIFVVWLVLFSLTSVTAAPLTRNDVPEALRPWIDWVLHGEKNDSCPILYNSGDQTVCAWPSFLKLDVQQSTAIFSQQWRVYAADVWLFLPGSDTMWPQEVMVNGTTLPVGERNGRPAVYITTPGEYSINGVFSFDRQPEWFRVPEQTGLIRLSINGKTVSFPRLDKEGRLWFSQEGDKEPEAESRENRLRVQVHRLIQDDIPLRMTTRLELSVSGKHREVRLGRAVTEDFIPMGIDSDLPVKVGADGVLVAQVRPGKWHIEIVARHKGPVTELTPAMVGGFDTSEEIWAFDARRHLRQVLIEGPTQIDPMQTTIPEAWRQYPVYLMTPQATMTFVVKKRGDPHPAPDQLNIERTFWLNFDGRGYSVRDHITGTMTTGWRLEVNPRQELGRATVNGQEQFITRMGDSGKAGVEMRYGSIDLVAESRIGRSGSLPVTGWERDFQSVKGTLNLPPGWSLFHAAGIDNIRDTWMSRWNLVDFFLVLIIAVTVARLYGVRWGLIALTTLVLLNHEPNAPRWIWLHLLAAIALLRVLPRGKIRNLVDFYRTGAIIGLVVISLPFMVSQVKYGFYPQLEHPWQVMGQNGQETESADVPVRRSRTMARQVEGKKLVSESLYDVYSRKSPASPVDMMDTGTRIQTGPGIPNWNWRRISFSWNGPVARDEQMRFILISPAVNLLLALVRAALLAALIFGLAGIVYAPGKGLDLSGIKPGLGAAAIILMMFGLAAVTPANAADTFPPESLLKELKIKLTDRDPPACLPDCASSPRMQLVIDRSSLRIRMEVNALYDDVAVPLPGSDQHWLPETVMVDNRRTADLYRLPAKGYLWLHVTEGSHQVDLRGPLPKRQTVQLPLPLKPHFVEARAEGWVIDGLHENGVADNQLQFTRVILDGDNSVESSGEAFDPVLLPPFLKVQRTISLGLNWQVETRVERLTPGGSAVVVAIPLLTGESVTSDIPVENDRVLINLGPNQTFFRWTSALEKQDTLVLKAADTLDWTEVWQVNVGPMWHADIQGIPVVHHRDPNGNWLPEWRPWPGEEVILHLTRPEGVGGQTHTIESSRMMVKPGQRIIKTELELEIRSSRGSRQLITLPEKAELQAVDIDGVSQPLVDGGNRVTLPLTPGRQKIHLTWWENKDLGMIWRTPKVDLGISSVDAFITAQMPQDRWLLFCGGPHVGPAVMFWSVVLVVVLMSVGLGRISITPLWFRHWLLLGLGLTQTSLLAALPVVAWFLMLGYRKRRGGHLSATAFNGLQFLLVVLTVAALVALLAGLERGLLGYPDMQIAGNGSGNYVLNWYQDISGNILPRAWVLSVPIIVYRLLILAWALWLSFALINWLRWAWESFSTGGLWRSLNLRKRIRNRAAGSRHDGDNGAIDLEDD